MKKGFTLIEMLVVLAILAILIGVSVGSFSKMSKTAEKARAQELVSNTATALTALFQKEGSWPRRLAQNGATDGRLDANAALPLVKGAIDSSGSRHKYMSLTTTGSGDNLKLAGLDAFGIVTPWATAAIKRAGNSASESTRVGTLTVQDHILHYALDLDGDGIIRGANVGGESVNIRASAAVWSIGKDGGNNGVPWPYKTGLKKGDVYSWSYGQTQNVN